MNPTPIVVTLVLGIIIMVIVGMAIVGALGKLVGKEGGLRVILEGIQELLTPKKKAPPPSWLQFSNWKKPAVDWAKWQKLLPQGGIKWNGFNWHSFRSGEMYVDGGTGANEPNIAHPSLKIGPKSGPMGVGVVVGFVTPTEGHTTLANVITPCFETKPDGVVVTEVTIKGFKQAVVMAGPVQSAFGDAVTDCITAGFLPNDFEMLQDLCWIGQGFAYPFADCDERIYYNNYVAVVMCIIKAILGLPTSDENQACETAHPFRGTVHENRRNEDLDTGKVIPRAPRPAKLVAPSASV